MNYFINNDPAHQKLHTKECYMVKKYKGTREFKDHWKSFETLEEAIEFCKKNKRKYRYCGLCFREKSRAVIK